MYSVSQLNQMTAAEFVAVLGGVFEHTPEIAALAWEQRPFESREYLHQVMVEIVNQMEESEQLKLIRAHPDLGSKAHMAPASVEEQAGVGLDSLSEKEYQEFQALNQAYQEKFGFPFIIAVRVQTKEGIMAAFRERLQNSPEEEKTQALTEINRIAWFRLLQLAS